MAIITYDPWHGDPLNALVPIRPSLAQIGGGAYQDDQTDPPDLDTMPSAAMENANEKALAGICRTMSPAVFSIHFAAGVPSIDLFSCADSSLVAGDFTITDNGVGDTSITWAADTFPVSVARPCGLTMNENAAIAQSYAIPIANGIRVITLDTAGNPRDCAFTVEYK